MAFLAQINLAEAHAQEPRLRLPQEGLLSFFLGEGELMLGTESSHRDGWRVVWSRPDQPLRRLTCSPPPQLYQACAVKFLKGGLALPDENCLAYAELDFDESQRDDYNELLSRLSPDDAGDQLLGFPNLIQGHPPELQCELAAAGLDPWGAGEPSDDIRHSAIERGLLLQLTSNSEANFLWGDGGHLYFYGKRSAMEVGDFSQVWATIET